MTMVEAMAAAMPVISTEGVGSAIDYLKNEANGFFYPCEDPEALAVWMSKFVGNPSLIYRLGTQARADIAELDVVRGAPLVQSPIESGLKQSIESASTEDI